MAVLSGTGKFADYWQFLLKHRSMSMCAVCRDQLDTNRLDPVSHGAV